jgi:hypothetical protein
VKNWAIHIPVFLIDLAFTTITHAYSNDYGLNYLSFNLHNPIKEEFLKEISSPTFIGELGKTGFSAFLVQTRMSVRSLRSVE